MSSKVGFWATTGLVAGLSLFSQSEILAGQVGIAPVRIYLDEATRTAVVEISNPGELPIGMQVDAMSWHQDNEGQNQYEPTTEILAFPPIFTIQPGQSQLVRIGLMTPQPAEVEKAYRLYFTELPPPISEAQSTALRMRLRVGIPVFSAPLSPPQFNLRLVESQIDDDQLHVSLHNPGNTHIRVADVYANELADMTRSRSARYILPGASQDFLLDLPEDAAISTIQAVTDQLGVTSYEVDLDPRAIPIDAELASR